MATPVFRVAFTPNLLPRRRQPVRAALVPRWKSNVGCGRQEPNRRIGEFTPKGDKSIPFGTTLHPYRRGTWKMGDAHDRGFVAKTIKNGAPGRAGLRGIVIRHHAEVRIFSLQRRMDYVPGDHCV